ncbi:MAG: quinone-dependent dihydroorotate dehydrogenase [Actinomycetales bacterium]|nr:quinone-dependent dihydroorotate dehydrogenase [Actinomycetales bacterium]
MVYRTVFDKALTRTDPEQIHHVAFSAIRAGRFATPAMFPVSTKPVEVMGIEFPHRFGLAAGFDKNVKGVVPLSNLGFGHVEVGTITGQAQPGNPKPRLFRLVDDQCIINRMGFNNVGAAEAASRLHRLRATKAGAKAVIGVNIGKTKVVEPERAVDDYALSARLLAPFADYLVVNVSSPNTPGLRDLQAVESLQPILSVVKEIADQQRNRVPLVVKIAPDLSDEDIEAVTALALDLGLDGISAANTTIRRPESLNASREQIEQIGAGGLSGPILRDRAVEIVKNIRAQAQDRLAIIGVGGIVTADDVRERIEAGADLVQGYTAFIYEGPAWPSKMARAAMEAS